MRSNTVVSIKSINTHTIQIPFQIQIKHIRGILVDEEDSKRARNRTIRKTSSNSSLEAQRSQSQTIDNSEMNGMDGLNGSSEEGKKVKPDYITSINTNGMTFSLFDYNHFLLAEQNAGKLATDKKRK